MIFRNQVLISLVAIVVANGCSRPMKFVSRTDAANPAQSTGDAKGSQEPAPSPAKSLPTIVDTNGKSVTPVDQQIANLSKLIPTPKSVQIPDAFFKFSKDKIVTNKDFDFGIEITNSSVAVASFRVSIVDSAGNPIVAAQTIQTDGSPTYNVTQKLVFGDGIYFIEATAIDAAETELRTEKISLFVDRSAPVVFLYLGVEPSRDPQKLACNTNPGSRSDVAMRIIPYDVCAVKTGPVALRITDICVLAESQATTPPPSNNSCWVSYSSMDFLALLANGKNDLVAFARDEIGNVGRGTASVVLKPANNPPVANLIEPSSSLVASKIFNDGDLLTVRWKVKSTDPYEKVRIAVSIIDADNQSRFLNLACNFANQRLAKACSDEAIQDTTGTIIKSEGNNTGSYTFKVPTGWGGINKHFYIQVQAFDVSGNSSVVATQDFNRGYEVLAGREFDGRGGSGLRLNRFDTRGGIVRVNKKGEVFDSAYGYKLSAFDGRSCRFFQTPSIPKTQTDCPDAFMNDDYSINAHWAYNRTKDVFYAIASKGGQEYIVEIDFNKKTITEIFGGAGKTDIDSSLRNVDVKKYRTAGLHQYLVYEGTLDRIFFRTLTQMYAINPTTMQLSYLLGNSASGEPADMQNVKQRDLVLADCPYKNVTCAFAVTPDRRLFMSLAGSDRPNAGGLYGTTFLIRDFSLDNPDQTTDMTMLPANSSNGGFISDYYYNSTNNSLVATLYASWVSELRLPDKSTTDIAAYKWKTLVVSGANSTNIFKSPLVSDSLPIQAPFQSVSIASSGFPNSFYIFDTGNGYLDYIDIESRTLEPVMGTDVGNTADELGINRDLRGPRHLFVDNDGNLVFSDVFNTQRIDLKNSDGQNPMIQTIRSAGANMPMRFDAAKNQVVRLSENGSSVDVFDYSKFSNPAVAPVMQFLGSQLGGHAVALSQNSSALKVASISIGGYTASVHLTDFTGYVNGNPAVAAQLVTNPNRKSFSSRWNWVGQDPMICYLDGNILSASDCAQAPLVNGNYYEASKYLAGGDTNHWGDSAYYNSQYTVPSAAFALNDTVVVACLSNTFVMIDKAGNKIYPFTPVDGNGQSFVLAGASASQPCYDRQAMFFNQNGRIFFIETGSTKPYEVDLSTVALTNKAKFTPITTQMPMAPGLYGSMFVTDTYVYYTHLHNVHRVLRNRR